MRKEPEHHSKVGCMSKPHKQAVDKSHLADGHHKMAKHYHKEMMKHMDAMHKMAKMHHKKMK